jgi:hypothetical protein
MATGILGGTDLNGASAAITQAGGAPPAPGGSGGWAQTAFAPTDAPYLLFSADSRLSDGSVWQGSYLTQAVPPADTRSLWIDTSVSPSAAKYFDNVASVWTPVATCAAAHLYCDTFTGNGAATTWTLSHTPLGRPWFTLQPGGLIVEDSALTTLSGASCTLNFAAAAGKTLEARYIA